MADILGTIKQKVEGAVGKIPGIGTGPAAINKAIGPQPAAAVSRPVAPLQPAAQQTRAIAGAVGMGAAYGAGGVVPKVKTVDNAIERIPMDKVK